MKLYATVTSERATKGQGGKQLDIEVTNEEKQTIAVIRFNDKNEYGAWFDERLIQRNTSAVNQLWKQKGKKQKDIMICGYQPSYPNSQGCRKEAIKNGYCGDHQ